MGILVLTMDSGISRHSSTLNLKNADTNTLQQAQELTPFKNRVKKQRPQNKLNKTVEVIL